MSWRAEVSSVPQAIANVASILTPSFRDGKTGDLSRPPLLACTPSSACRRAAPAFSAAHFVHVPYFHIDAVRQNGYDHSHSG